MQVVIPEVKKMKAYSLEEKRKEHSNAYFPWTESEEELLIKLLDTDNSIEQVSLKLERGPGAIISKLRKLGYEFEKGKPEYYNEIARWARDYLDDILEEEKVTYKQIAELIKELIDAIQKPSLGSDGETEESNMLDSE